MVEDLIETVGWTNFVFLIIGVALLLVIVLFMSYYRVVISIANFTYPNALFRSGGNPYLKEKKITNLIEGGNLNEVYSEISEEGYEIPKESREDIDKVELELEKRTVELIKKAHNASPDETKGFTKAWMAKYDVMMAKRAIKGIAKGENEEKLKGRLHPVDEINEDIIEDILSSRNLQEVLSVLRETSLEKVLEKKDWEENFFDLDVALDKYVFERLQSGIFKVESEQRAPVRNFYGKYIDIWNIKTVLRGIREDIENEILKDSLIPNGRELALWKMEDMAESKSVDEALVELEATSYQNIRHKMQSEEDFDFERYLDKKLLKTVIELNNKNVLTVGPTLKYLVGKELELRNLRALIYGIKEGLPKGITKEMMILEENT